jgi:hypothetical protein
MPDIYVCGHGGWGIVGRANIFTKVPAGTEVVLYREIGSLLYVPEACDILARSPNALRPARTIKSPNQCPDLTLYPAREFWNALGEAAQRGGTHWLAVAQDTRLSDILRRYGLSRVHWIACEVRELGRYR